MINLHLNQIDPQSFTDAKLLGMQVDLESKAVKLLLHKEWIIHNDTIVSMLYVEIVISAWDQLKVLIEEMDVSEFKRESPLTSEILGDICEIEHNGKFVLRGYGKGYNGCWTEWIFLNPHVTIYGSTDEKAEA